MSGTATAAREETPKDGLAAVFDLIGAVLSALLDVFKPPPTEATDTNAPGLAALGPGGVAAALRGCKIQSVGDGSRQDASELTSSAPWDAILGGGTTVLLFITHFGDFNSWEVLQQLRTASREGRLANSKVAVVGIGTPESGRKLVELLELPEDLQLFADPEGACHRALGFSRGALPQYAEQLNPYFRVFLMLLGVGSPGTISTVLSGYFGNRDVPRSQTLWIDEALKQGAVQGRFPTRVPTRLPWEAKKADGEEWADLATAGSTVWDNRGLPCSLVRFGFLLASNSRCSRFTVASASGSTLWDNRGYGDTGLRPFELATVRLQNMVGGIIEHWDELKPPDDELLVQQGGAVVLRGGEAVYFYRDKGILTYVPLEDALNA